LNARYLLLIGAILCWVAQWYGVGRRTDLVATPTAEVQKLVAGVRSLAGKNLQRRELGAYYAALADCVRRDGQGQQRIKTPAIFRDVNNLATTLRFQAALERTPGLAAAIDAAIMEGVGPKAGELDAARRGRIVELLDGIAWACGV
jgi:hypothetical protein